MSGSETPGGRHLAVAASIALTLAALGNPAFAQDERMAGVWQIESPVHALRTSDGTEPPLRPEAAEIYRKHIAMRQQGDTSFDSATWCASVGTPRAMLINYPFEIAISPTHIAFLHEWNWWARIVYLDDTLGPLPEGGKGFSVDQLQPGQVLATDQEGPMGLSQGRWEGRTLVIETTMLRATTLLDNSGLPHSDQLKLTEHLRLIGRNRLEDRIRIEDPVTFAEPWEAVVTYRRQDKEIKEDVCLDRVKAGEPAVRG